MPTTKTAAQKPMRNIRFMMSLLRVWAVNMQLGESQPRIKKPPMRQETAAGSPAQGRCSLVMSLPAIDKTHSNAKGPE